MTVAVESPTALSVADARSEFDIPDGTTYANTSVNSLIPRRTRAAVERYLDLRCRGALSKDEQLATVEHCRTQFAGLIGAHADEVAMVKNVSEGVSLIATALDWQPGDNVVLCQDLEHPSNVFPWHNIARRFGVEVRQIPQDEGRIPVDGMISAIDTRTRLLTAPTVGFSPGFRTPTKALSSACRAGGVFFLLDAAQSVGVLHTDVEALGVDALTVATQKGLMAFYGAGFLYCKREVAERMIPSALGRFGVDFQDGAGETAVEGDDFRYAAGARRFDGGNYNYLGITAASASISLIQEVGSLAVEAHVRSLADALATGLLAAGLPVCGGSEATDRAHIVTVGEPGAGGHDSAEDPRIHALFEHLAKAGIKLSIRRGVLRFSFHLYNDQRDVNRILSEVDDWLAVTP